MADVYAGGIPDHGFQTNAGVSIQAESSETPGGPAGRPNTVKEGGPTVAKNHSVSKSENFLLDPSYESGLSVQRVSGDGKTVNPDDISHADSC